MASSTVWWRVTLSTAAVAVVAALVVVVVLFVTPWSRPCEEEAERAEAAWSTYLAHVEARTPEATRVEASRRIRGRITGDPAAALEQAESLVATPEPGDERGATLYRDAMETLVLAEGACAP
jgi:hypothetical protein